MNTNILVSELFQVTTCVLYYLWANGTC